MTVHGVDYSHWQSPPSTSHPPNVAQMQAGGIEFVIIKAWDGDGHDPEYLNNARNAQAAGLPMMAYAWIHANDTDERMQKCFDFIGNAVLMLDWEEAGVPASVVEAWMDAYEKRYGRAGAAYYGIEPPDEATARIGKWLRVFPEYTSGHLRLPAWDGSADPDFRTCWAIWQSSEAGQVAGIEGNSDLDQLAPAFTLDEFKAWLAAPVVPGPTPVPVPVPPPEPDPPLDPVRVAIMGLQTALNNAGFNAGSVDGLWGGHTQAAVNKYSGFNG